MTKRLLNFLTLSAFGLTAIPAHAGIIGNVHACTTAILAQTQKDNVDTAVRKLRNLDAGFVSHLSDSILMTPKLPSGFFETAPNTGLEPIVGQRAGLKAIALPGASEQAGKPLTLPPGMQAAPSTVEIRPRTSDIIGYRSIAESVETALPIWEALVLAPGEKRTKIPMTADPLIRPLPAVSPAGTRDAGRDSGKPEFGTGGVMAPGMGDSVTQGSAPVVMDPKIKATQDTKVSIVANSVDLNRVLSILSDQTKANLVLLAPVETKLTVRLQQVRFIDALRHICTLTGLSYVTAKGAYILGPAEKLKEGYPFEWKDQHPEDRVKDPINTGPTEVKVDPPKEPEPQKEPVIARTVQTNYVDSQSMADAIKGLLGEGAIQVAPGPSQLSPSIVDRDTQQTTGVTQGVIQNDGKPISRTLILRGPESLVKDALQIVKELDIPRPQVALSVTIHDITDTALKELGVTWELGGFTINETPSTGVNVGRITRTGTSFAAALKGLEQTDKAKLLASPSVRVMDRERAFVLIGSRLKFPVVSSYSNTGNPIVTTQEEKVGVYLQVAPQVATDGSIMMTLYPQVSTVVSFVQIAGGSYPQIDSREAQTTLRVKSGETIVIGGLYKDEELSKIQQVPILAQIPLIGELFKNRKKTKTSSQVIITLAVELVNPE